MVGGGDDFLDGLQRFCAAFRAENKQSIGNFDHQIKAVEDLISRAKRQPGFDFLEGLQAFIDKEKRNKGQAAPSGQWQAWRSDAWTDWGATWPAEERQQAQDGASLSWTKEASWSQPKQQGNDGEGWGDWHQSRARGWSKNKPKEEAWGKVAWKPRPGDWESSQTTELHVVHGAVAFSAALDDHKDDAFLVVAEGR